MLQQHFDKIVCINLVNRPDKKKYAQSVFSRFKIPVEFFNAKNLPQGGRYGCFHSHISVITDAYNKGVQNLLVFEDDILPTPSYNSDMLQEAINFMEDPKQDWEYFQLGHFPHNNQNGNLIPYITAKTIIGYPHVVKFCGLGTHAYCLNRRGMKAILNSDWRNDIDYKHVDIFFAEFLKGYCVVPSLFEQKFCMGTDNQAINIREKIPRMFACSAEKTNFIHLVSLLKYTFNTCQIILLCVCTVLTFLLVAVVILRNV
jgi:GR25 family glycosyltransferase involved in LPS biosynthesis